MFTFKKEITYQILCMYIYNFNNFQQVKSKHSDTKLNILITKIKIINTKLIKCKRAYSNIL